MIHILDTSAKIAFLDREPGADVVRKVLVDNPGECYAHVFNLCEVYYIYYRRGGVAAAEAALQNLFHAGLIAREDIDTAFWKEVGRLKGSHAMSLPDAFCVNLARRLSGTAVTSDHGEFDPLVPLGYCPILFIR